MPLMISAGMSRWKPSVNILPRPPKPSSAPTVTRLMLDTVATRTWEVVGGGVESYEGGYNDWVFARAERSLRAAEAELQGRGRLVIRKSGTEPLIRVMAEGEDRGLVERLVDDICEAVQSAA